MSYKVLTLKDAEEWNKFLHKLPTEQQDIYFTPEYYSLYQNNGDGEALCFVYEENGNIALYPFLKNSINALGYKLDKEYFDIQGAYGYNGIVSSSKDKLFIYQFHKCFDQFCDENNIVAEFCRFHPLLNNYILAANQMQVFFDRKTVYFDLHKEREELISDFQRTTRKQIRRAKERFGIEVNICNYPLDYIDSFYDIYSQTMDKVKSTPYLYFNKAYFKELFSIPNLVLFQAKMQDVTIAYISSFYSNNFFHGHLGGSQKDYLKSYVNDLLYYEMMLYAKDKGYKYLHVGGGNTSDENNSLLMFKMNFSKSLADFYIGKKVHDQGIYNQVVAQWKENFSESYEHNRVKLLGYREI